MYRSSWGGSGGRGAYYGLILNFATGEPGKVQGRNRVGIVEGSCGYQASIRAKFVLSRNPGTRRGGCHVAKRSSDPR